jgi:hypothetical protein
MTTQRNASATPTSTDTLGNRAGFSGGRKWHFGKHDVIDLGNVRDGGLIQHAGGPLAGRNLLEEGERHQ